MTTTRPTHLQLISSTENLSKEATPSHSESKQLELSLPDDQSVIMITAQAVSPRAFYTFLDEVAPKLLFDARVVPRLDLLAGSRQQAFQWFSEHGCCYVDLFGRLSVVSRHSASVNPAIWTEACIDLLKSKRNRCGPYVFIFDDDEVLAAAEEVVTNALRAHTKNDIRAMRWPQIVQGDPATREGL